MALVLVTRQRFGTVLEARVSHTLVGFYLVSDIIC